MCLYFLSCQSPACERQRAPDAASSSSRSKKLLFLVVKIEFLHSQVPHADCNRLRKKSNRHSRMATKAARRVHVVLFQVFLNRLANIYCQFCVA